MLSQLCSICLWLPAEHILMRYEFHKEDARNFDTDMLKHLILLILILKLEVHKLE